MATIDLINIIQGIHNRKYEEIMEFEAFKLRWSEEYQPNENIRYNHIKLQTPMGEFIIEWKGWKENDSMCLYIDGDYITSEYTKEEAQEAAFNFLKEKADKLNEFLRS